MGKIFCLMGKSATGKDTIYKQLISSTELELLPIVPYTTRPIREGEKEGVEYHFVNKEQLDRFRNDKKVIEERSYDTVHGKWYYFMAEDGQIDIQNNSYLYIGTLISYLQMKEHFGDNDVLPIYIELDDGLRLQRALDREKQQAQPKYAELCRRYLADLEDFSEENMSKANIIQRFTNKDIEECLKEVINHIKRYL